MTATETELKLNYNSLAEPIPGQYEHSNLFAVIIDFPVCYRMGDKWMLGINVIDQSLNQRATNEINAPVDKYNK